MFITLPESIQQQILFYLEANNFRAAKELRDQSLRTPLFMDDSQTVIASEDAA